MENIDDKVFNDIKKYLQRTEISIFNENRNTEFNNSYYEKYIYEGFININKINEMLLNRIYDLEFINTGNINNYIYYHYNYKGKYYILHYLFNNNQLSSFDISIYSKLD